MAGNRYEIGKTSAEGHFIKAKTTGLGLRVTEKGVFFVTRIYDSSVPPISQRYESAVYKAVKKEGITGKHFVINQDFLVETYRKLLPNISPTSLPTAEIYTIRPDSWQLKEALFAYNSFDRQIFYEQLKNYNDVLTELRRNPESLDKEYLKILNGYIRVSHISIPANNAITAHVMTPHNKIMLSSEYLGFTIKNTRFNKLVDIPRNIS